MLGIFAFFHISLSFFGAKSLLEMRSIYQSGILCAVSGYCTKMV